ncbi:MULTISPECIES: LLM class F420-dependent oxidoreductase [Microbacterium]|uniref:LLM class F420-dependent oxidoreductase n=1 Tax=Microbacterium wangchenii TaxID=2541726 RepID=A0ABX5SYE6_9MICO|nr:MULTISPECIES: LLM class F420-dependent oxidoreductase [Microbacterium]MCK6067177.1 LLM class F420-dependent oxidoreductase [Microbacterium sp. EYE_512]QBR89869.1 LLM class F420-dependent oxidoreductase [Microbacterium wangchenii]TFV85273.1 LLM class F420-dependent oxidoreductase [Microbacterium sp. dk485]TXK16534.1 LLM class F420-dependent oxidoreductase [Microbacterium wangchenii]
MEYCIFTEPQQGYDYDDQLAFALAAERLGFDAFIRSDHYLRMGEGDPLPGGTDAWTTLAGLARETSRIRLGTLVSSATHRLPGVLAVQVAQVDQMSGGRVEFGLGTGWFEREHRAYGIPFPAKRFGILEEQLAILTGMWQTPVGERFDFAGEHYTVEDSPALPKPVQTRMPVIVGGGGPRRTPAVAARFATEFNIGFVPEPTVAEKFAGVRAACEAIGRDPRTLKLSVATPTLAGASETDVARRAATLGRDLDEYRGNGGNVAGGRAEIAAKVERLQALGAERVYFQLMDMGDLEQLEYLGSEVLPHLPR